MDFELQARPSRRLKTAASFQFGIEEEYFVCDAATLQVVKTTPDTLFSYRHSTAGAPLNREMLQAQLEVATRPHTSCRDAHSELLELRRIAAEAAAQHGLVILAVGTHPTADWTQAVQSPKHRYDQLIEGLQMVGRRNMLCGMHVHVELPDPEARIHVMARMTPYVPLLIALSTSSPFWRSQCTGLKGYRLAAYDELPRTGLPELFHSKQEYDAYVSALVCSNAIPNATHVWWAIRPSDKYPTLELRATDCCTRLDDAVAVAALYRCLVSRLWRQPSFAPELSTVDRAIAVENKWRAQRYGVRASFVSRAGAISTEEMLEETLDAIAQDADVLECWDDVVHCRTIASRGSSADAQLRTFAENAAANAGDGLDRVLRWIADTTCCDGPAGNPQRTNWRDRAQVQKPGVLSSVPLQA